MSISAVHVHILTAIRPVLPILVLTCYVAVVSRINWPTVSVPTTPGTPVISPTTDWVPIGPRGHAS